MICLDTNIAIYVMNRRIPSVRHRLAEQLRLGTEIGFPAIALFELRYGYARSNRRIESELLLEEFLAPGIAVLPFEAEDASHAGDIRAYLESKGTPIGPYDCLIAAQARRHSAALVTLNTREFSRVPGLIVVDWAA
ncbi:type II toxin-antitoxin system VapC family toxin [Bradyrhizobium cenepequi]|uniref:type II toxin-antitoxin system VapC family toxin n=1 Tax=Bradyrhizobium cenepequi TaxID=2821403 RepID=UPI001CE34419|nr:type II toxin-antitoxin system VapC family toxin [Bradyrhizobium cenepequi]MCA6111883.1 type II toxin-antitoxin system VapC family toxin [Bradyrhizobium cenepequi]